jgi:hypothetical protein
VRLIAEVELLHFSAALDSAAIESALTFVALLPA